MKRKTRLICLLLAMIMSISLLAGCGKDDDDNGSNGSKTSNPEYVYVPSYKTLKVDGVDYINNSIFAGDKIVFTASVKDGKEEYTNEETGITESYDTYKEKLFSLDIASGEVSTINYEISNEGSDDGGSYVQSMFAGANGSIGLVSYTYKYQFDLPSNFDPATDDKWNYFVSSTNSYSITYLDAQGNIISELDLTDILGQDGYFDSNRSVFDDEGNMYLNANSEIVVISKEGEEISRIACDNEDEWINNIFTFGEGRIAASTYYYNQTKETSEQRIKEVNLETKTFGEGIEAPYNAYNYYPGDDNYDLYWSNNSSFYGYDVEKGESTKLLGWISCDVDFSSIVGAPVVDESGNITLLSGGSNSIVYGRTSSSKMEAVATSSSISSDASSNASFELITLIKTPYDEAPQKETLTIACVYLDYSLRREIINFNKRSTNFRLDVADYSEYNTETDYSAGITKLNTEIISGKIPDLLMTSNLPLSHYESLGLLEDLVPHIESDTELGGMSGLVEPVFKALMNDKGELFQIVDSFQIMSLAGNPQIVGTNGGWTLDEFYEAYAKMPEGTDILNVYTTQDQIMSSINALCLDQFIDWETGNCSFDSQEFKDLLEFISLFPSDFDWDGFDWEMDYEEQETRVANGKQMLVETYLYDFRDYQRYRFMFGGDVTFVGYPTATRDGSGFSLSTGIAMSSTCEHKDYAWEFMRTILGEEYQNTRYQFPTNKALFDELLSDAMTPQYTTDPETGEQVEMSVYSIWVDGNTYDLYAMTQEEADALLDVIESTTRVYEYDTSLTEIISDATAAYFAGSKSLDDTASIVQSRVKLYINEQR